MVLDDPMPRWTSSSLFFCQPNASHGVSLECTCGLCIDECLLICKKKTSHETQGTQRSCKLIGLITHELCSLCNAFLDNISGLHRAHKQNNTVRLPMAPMFGEEEPMSQRVALSMSQLIGINVGNNCLPTCTYPARVPRGLRSLLSRLIVDSIALLLSSGRSLHK
jgi:hypothetical protein